MLNAYPDWKIPGEVIAIIPTADRSKATVKVRIALKPKDPRIVPDMGVRVRFLEPQAGAARRRAAAPACWCRPRRCARDGDHGRRVRRRRRQGASAARSRWAHDVGGQRQVLSGLRAGERVVLSPPRVARRTAHAVKLAETS